MLREWSLLVPFDEFAGGLSSQLWFLKCFTGSALWTCGIHARVESVADVVGRNRYSRTRWTDLRRVETQGSRLRRSVVPFAVPCSVFAT